VAASSHCWLAVTGPANTSQAADPGRAVRSFTSGKGRLSRSSQRESGVTSQASRSPSAHLILLSNTASPDRSGSRMLSAYVHVPRVITVHA
jgi:hypothetical protein